MSFVKLCIIYILFIEKIKRLFYFYIEKRTSKLRPVQKLKVIRGMRLDNRKVFRAPGSRTKHFEPLFFRLVNCIYNYIRFFTRLYIRSVNCEAQSKSHQLCGTFYPNTYYFNRNLQSFFLVKT